MSLAGKAEEGSILLVFSSGEDISSGLAAGFRRNFTGRVSELSLDKTSAEDIQAISGRAHDLVLSIGSGTIEFIEKLDPEIPVIFLHVDQEGPLDISRKNALLLGAEVSVSDQLGSFKEFMPGIEKLGVIYSPARFGDYVNEALSVCDERGISLVARPTESIKDFPSMVREVIPRVDAIWVLNDPEFSSREAFNYLLLIAFENNVPVLASSSRLVKSGAVFACVPDHEALGAQAAGMAERILGGETPGSMRIDAVVGRAAINQRTTGLFKIPVSEDLKARAILY